jgi:hypothetical protein
MPYKFITPTIKTFPVGGHRLFEFFQKLDLGVTVYKINGTYYEDPYPDEDTLNIASAVYPGGHVNIVSNAVAAELTTAGYGAYLTLIS